MGKPGMVAAVRRGWGRVVLWAIRPALEVQAEMDSQQYAATSAALHAAIMSVDESHGAERLSDVISRLKVPGVPS